MVVTVFEEPVKRRYQAPVCSLSFCFMLISAVGMVLIPFYVAYASSGFWLKRSIYMEQPRIEFKYNVLMVLQGYAQSKNGSKQEMRTWAWSTVPEVRDAYEDYLRAPIIRAWKTDKNLDSKADVWTVTMQMPLSTGEKVHQVQALAFFEYHLDGRAHLSMDGLAYLEHSSPLPGVGLLIEGEARLNQRQALSIRRTNAHPEHHFDPYPEPSSMYPNLIATTISSYAKRNHTLKVENQYKVWQTTNGMDEYSTVSNSFGVNFTLQIPTDEIVYTPDVAEVLKVAWIQYFSLAAIFYIMFYILRSFVYSNQVLETIIASEGRTQSSRKQHRF